MLLQLVIGFGEAFGLLMVAFLILFGSGRTQAQFDALDAQGQSSVGGAAWLLILGTELAWLLFVYLRVSLSVRVQLLVGIAGAAFIGTLAILFRTLPQLA